jgi:uncharacterized SAM-binding protein YcdF (DUF218 family)
VLVIRLVRVGLKVVLGLFALLVLYLGVTFVQVWWASRQAPARPHPSSAIVVMGAAQYNGQPSPVLKARLDHAADLYEQGVAPMIVVTGGKKPGDRVTQGRTGFEYLRDRGIPESAIKIEVEGTNSYQELSAAALIIEQAGTEPEVVIVSDPYHSLRISQIAEQVGLTPHLSPDNTSSPLRSLVRETAAVAVGRIVGYRRLSNAL